MSGFQTGQPYKFVSKLGSVCLDVFGSGTADGTPMQIFGCKAATLDGNQRFAMDPVTGGFRIVSLLSSKCVDVPAASIDWGTQLALATCNGTAAQAFTFTALAGGYYKINNVNSTLCMDVQSSNTADGTPVQQWECNNTDAQSWLLQTSP
jgi:hypothetical protein